MTGLGELAPVDPAHMNVGAAPRVLLREALDIFATAARNAPRTLQRRIGPSEIGTPCARRLAYKLAEAPEHNHPDGWRPTVGTAVHAWIAESLAEHNIRFRERHGFTRYLIEQRVTVGAIGGEDVSGSSDCYDRVTAEVIDWKVVGVTTLKSVKRAARVNALGGIGPISKPGYRVQAHLYGLGFERAGLPVHGVNVVYLPSSGELRDAQIEHEPYDRSIAAQAIARADAIAGAMAAAGAENMISGLPREDDFCTYCPFYSPGAKPQYVWDGCPGAPVGTRDESPNESGLIAAQLV